MLCVTGERGGSDWQEFWADEMIRSCKTGDRPRSIMRSRGRIQNGGEVGDRSHPISKRPISAVTSRIRSNYQHYEITMIHRQINR